MGYTWGIPELVEIKMGFTWESPDIGWESPGIYLDYDTAYGISVTNPCDTPMERKYPQYIPNPTFCLRKNRGPGDSATPAPPTIASERRASSSSSLTPMRAGRHTGGLPLCVLTTLILGYDVKNMHNPRNMSRHIDLFESSPVRASRLISKQVVLIQLLLNGSNRAACHAVQLWTLVSDDLKL